MKCGCKFFCFFALLMKGNTLKRRGITFLLLLIFFQQMGAGLFVHNLVHNKNHAGQQPTEQKENGGEINFACRCVDDFLMPFVAGDELSVLPNPEIYAKPVDTFSESIYFTSLIISSLRGPPVFIG